MTKYYHNIKISTPIKVYVNQNNLYDFFSVLDRNKYFFYEEDFDIEYGELGKEFTGFLSFDIKGLIPCTNQDGMSKSFYSENVPNFIIDSYIESFKKIEGELIKKDIYIEDLDEYEVGIKYDEASPLSLSDLLLFKENKTEKNKISIDTSDEILKKIEKNIDNYLVDAFLLTGDKTFIKNVPNAKEKIKDIIKSISNTKIKKTDIAKAVEYLNKPYEVLFINDENIKKAVFSLKIASRQNKKIEKNKENLNYQFN